MSELISTLLGRAGDLLGTEPILALFLGAALVAVFLSTSLNWRNGASPGASASTGWTIYRQISRIVWALVLTACLGATIGVVRSYLSRTYWQHRQTHGRVSETNLDAVRTIWGAEQQQCELTARLWYEVEETERLKSEDPTRPEIVRTKRVQRSVNGNAYASARHAVTLKQNPRKKGSAMYPGYETDCRFTYRLKNPADRDVKTTLHFALPSWSAMYNDLAVSLNGQSVLDRLEMQENTLVVYHELKTNETCDFEVAFKSRGLSYWYFQITETREIRDFVLTLSLPDLARDNLNYPEGCMTPTSLEPTADGRGSVLTFALDRAISNKGMGVAMPRLEQPGETTGAVLAQSANGWLLLVAAVVLSLTLAGLRHPVLVSLIVAVATAFGYGLMAGLSDTVLGFWGTFALVWIPLYGLMNWLIVTAHPTSEGRWLTVQVIAYGIVFPCVAGMDPDRQPLYLNLAAAAFLALLSVQLLRHVIRHTRASAPAIAASHA